MIFSQWKRRVSQIPRGDLVAGFVLAIVSVVSCQSFGALVFAAEVPEAPQLGTRAALVTATIAGMVIGLMSTCRGTIATAQERVAPILALLTASVVQRVPDGTPASAKAWTVLAAMACTSMI